jgi:hypothetical protein
MAKDPEINRIIDDVAERNRVGLRLARADSVPVGSFWFMQEPGEPPAIVADRVFVQTGKGDGRRIICHEDNVNCWRSIKERLARGQTLDYLHGFGPDDWPRGRVVFDTFTKRFEVYLDEQLQTPQFQKQILAHFHLTKDETSFAIDPRCTAVRFILGPDGPRERTL